MHGPEVMPLVDRTPKFVSKQQTLEFALKTNFGVRCEYWQPDRRRYSYPIQALPRGEPSNHLNYIGVPGRGASPNAKLDNLGPRWTALASQQLGRQGLRCSNRRRSNPYLLAVVLTRDEVSAPRARNNLAQQQIRQRTSPSRGAAPQRWTDTARSRENLANRRVVPIEQPCDLMQRLTSLPTIPHLRLLLFGVIDSGPAPHLQHSCCLRSR